MISNEHLQSIIDNPSLHTERNRMIAAELLTLRKAREGWKLVPVEPTKEMRLASRRYAAKNKITTGPGFYRAMVAAAPTPHE